MCTKPRRDFGETDLIPVRDLADTGQLLGCLKDSGLNAGIGVALGNDESNKHDRGSKEPCSWLTIELYDHLMLRSCADHCMAAQHNMQAVERSDKTTLCVRAAWNITIDPRENVMLREFAV